MLGFLLSLIPGFSTLSGLAQFGIGVLYPTWESFRAIESTGVCDDTQWLSYWVVYAVYSLVEKFTWPVLMWVPLYSLAKIAFLAWLTLPQFRGATFVYSQFVRPFLLAVADKAKDIPQLEPFVQDFTAAAAQMGKKAQGAAKAMGDSARDAAAKVDQGKEETFQPFKTHAQ